jgi:FMNH2-dependent dimethyl sulfone monooxygenase
MAESVTRAASAWTPWPVEDRAMTNPVFGDNPLKIGIFSFNFNGGRSLIPERWQPSWANCLHVARTADEAGIEALVPIARWKGFGGPSEMGRYSFETYAWAAGLAQATRHIGVFTTSHVRMVHPAFAAKQAVTIDHISGGRFGVNVVCGWYQAERDLFGQTSMDHDELYRYGEEWLDLLKTIWTRDEEFDYNGKYFTVHNGLQDPKPVQRPYPALMNAGSSEVGRRFAGRYCDIALISLNHMGAIHNHPPGSGFRPGAVEYEEAARKVDAYRRMAREEFGREMQVWSRAYVVCRPTEREAQEYVHRYVYDYGDWESMENQSQVRPHWNSPEEKKVVNANRIAGAGGWGLVGTAEQIVDILGHLRRRVGLDGLLISSVDHRRSVPELVEHVLPLMEQDGLRKPYRPAA